MGRKPRTKPEARAPGRAKATGKAEVTGRVKGKRKSKVKPAHSIWDGADDWAQLVADSALSTSSVSVRAPRPRGVHTLARCAQDAAARSWRRMRDEDASAWRAAWAGVPPHLQAGVRDGVFKWHADVLTAAIVRDAFIVPPHFYLPGALLPFLSSLDKLKPLHPPDYSVITSLTVTYLDKAPDIALAGTVGHMPNLEAVNLKCCSLAGKLTVKTLVQRCKKVKRINLKGTKVQEKDVVSLLDTYGQQFETFKVDGVKFTADDTFTLHPFWRVTHLCLPGDAVSPVPLDFRARAQKYGQTLAYPAPRPARPGQDLTWDRLGTVFPALTHLYLPGLYLLPDATIGVAPGTLRKLALGPGGPLVPLAPLTALVKAQPTLEKVYLGHLVPVDDAEREFAALGDALARCDMVDFRLETDPAGSRDWRCDKAMAQHAHLLYVGLGGKWAPSLKHLVIATPQAIPAALFMPATASAPALERLELASASFDDIDIFAKALRACVNLRSLDVSGTAITDEHLFGILDHCRLLSRIDLTSCRGVNVRHRRNIFKAWEESRESHDE
ncbi:hypothetical protein Q5752_002347 [Cryptotrichosporon argae]